MMPDPMYFIHIPSVILFPKTPRLTHDFATIRYQATSARPMTGYNTSGAPNLANLGMVID
jgi:hypothetical protein